ncbi:MAG: hypothetical protein V2J07_01145 [Anaerolineae bacterium]|nr:hypothetical protein [Anaerolineae bacterium]
MQNRRYLWFIITIVIGLLFGLLLGWNVFSRAPEQLGLDVLREDYKMDYVLMIAKFYQAEKDLAGAQRMLDLIEPDEEKLLVLIEDTVDMLNARPTDEITATVDIQSVLILQQALKPETVLFAGEVAA